MFPRFAFASFFLVAMVFSGRVAYAGKVELTTYYPAPYGEYSELNASKSFIPPRMITAERDLITSTSTPPLAQGMVIFNTDPGVNRLEVYNGTAWVSAAGGGAIHWVALTGGSVRTYTTVSSGEVINHSLYEISMPTGLSPSAATDFVFNYLDQACKDAGYSLHNGRGRAFMLYPGEGPTSVRRSLTGNILKISVVLPPAITSWGGSRWRRDCGERAEFYRMRGITKYPYRAVRESFLSF